jgi:hypothetical protein
LNAGRFAPRRIRAEIPAPTTPPRCNGYGAGDFRLVCRNADSAERFSRRSRRAAAASKAQKRSAKTAYREAICVQNILRP